MFRFGILAKSDIWFAWTPYNFQLIFLFVQCSYVAGCPMSLQLFMRMLDDLCGMTDDELEIVVEWVQNSGKFLAFLHIAWKSQECPGSPSFPGICLLEMPGKPRENFLHVCFLGFSLYTKKSRASHFFLSSFILFRLCVLCASLRLLHFERYCTLHLW